MQPCQPQYIRSMVLTVTNLQVSSHSLPTTYSVTSLSVSVSHSHVQSHQPRQLLCEVYGNQRPASYTIILLFNVFSISGTEKIGRNSLKPSIAKCFNPSLLIKIVKSLNKIVMSLNKIEQLSDFSCITSKQSIHPKINSYPNIIQAKPKINQC